MTDSFMSVVVEEFDRVLPSFTGFRQWNDAVTRPRALSREGVT